MPDRSPLPARKPRVFLSYAREDAASRDDVRAALEAFADVWVDTEILPGTQWPRDTMQAIADRDVMVLLVSRHSMDPVSYCLTEAAEADRLGKRVVCLQLERFEKARLDPRVQFLRSINWIDRSHPDWPGRLRTAIETDFDRVRLHAIIAARLSQYEDPATRGGLLAGGLLKRARALAGAAAPTDRPTLNPDQRAFIQRGVRRRRWLTIVAFASVLVIAAVIGVVVIRSRAATDAADRAQAASELARAAGERSGEDPQTALRLSLAAYALDPGRPMRDVVYQVLSRTHLAASFHEIPGPATAVTLDGKGRTMLAAGAGNTVTLWDLTDRLRPRPINWSPAPPAAGVIGAAFAPDGQSLALADSAGSVSIWRRGPTGMIRTIPDVASGATGYRPLLFSPDGRSLAVSTAAGVQLLKLTADRAEPGPVFATSPDRPATFSPTGAVLATIGQPGLTMWDLSGTGRPKRMGKAIPAVAEVAFRPDGREFVISTGTGGRRIARYALPAGSPREVGKTVDLVWGAEHLAFDPASRSMAVVDFQHGVRHLTAETLQPEGQTFTARSDSLLPSAVSDDASTLVTSTGDGSVTVWDLTDRGQPAVTTEPLAGMAKAPLSLAYGLDDHILVTGSRNAPTLVWRRSGSGWGAGEPIGGTTDTGSFAFGPGSRLMFAAGLGGPSGLFDIVTRSGRIEPPDDADVDRVNLVVGTVDGQRFAVSNNQNVIIWELGSTGARRLGQLPVQLRTFAMAFAPGGKTLAVGAGDPSAPDRGQVMFWDISDPAHATMLGQPLRSPAQVGTALDVSSDGRLVAIGAGADTFSIVDAATRSPIGPAHPGSGSEAVFFAMGSRLLVTEGASEAMIWDVEDRANPQPLGLPLTGTKNQALAVSNSEAVLASGTDGAALEWNLTDLIRQRDRAVDAACVAAGGGFDQAEWRANSPRTPFRKSCPPGPVLNRPTTPAAITAAPSAPTAMATVPMKLFSSSMKATAYFGRLADVRGVAGPGPTSVAGLAPDACAETIVVRDVPGPAGVVYADGLGTGWRAAESAPSDKAGSARTLHQQIVLPPAEAEVGSGWSLAAIISAGGEPVDSAPISLLLTARNGRAQTWRINETQTVACTGD